MAEDKKHRKKAAPRDAAEAPAPEDAVPEAEAEAAEAAPETVPGEEAEAETAAARTAELEAEAAELKDKLLRALAEVENVRRRAQRDREDASRYAIADFAREMLSVADNLERAQAHIDAEARRKDEALEALASGVEMTGREVLAIFERFGIKPIEALGKRFDHNLHEAMFELDDPSQPAGTVVHEMRRGYLLGERLLRAAQVGVSKGGPVAENGEAGEKGPEGGSAPGRSAYERQADQESAAPGTKGGQVDENL